MEAHSGDISLNVNKFATARVAEIQSVKHLLQSQKGVKLAFQKLPIHMRRRVMAHNSKRVPSSIRAIYASQLKKSGQSAKQKRPSRKYRRRPKSLNSEILRRQRTHKWLETHIWHAKRFKMVTKWGHKIPYEPCDKAFRACYRATNQHCLLQDISYVSCIELKGPQTVIVEGLKKISKAEMGLSVGAKAYRNGNREGMTLFFHNNESQSPIGNVRFHWRPNLDTKHSVLWLWTHAAYYTELFEVLIDLFGLHAVKGPDAKVFGNCDKGVVVTNLSSELNRFRLTGPLSQAVLAQALKPFDTTKGSVKWLESFLQHDDERQIFSEQQQFWKRILNVQSPAQLSPRIVFSLTVSDPRFSLPSKRTKAINLDIDPENNIPSEVAKNLSSGPLWDTSIRAEMVKSKLSNHEINEIRSEMLVPGSDIDNKAVPVALLFIQRPGLNKTGYGCGWDVIIPKSWGRVFWLSFIMRGARVGGLRETENVNFEMQNPPILLPDSKAGQSDDRCTDELYRTKFFKLPPNKRINYNKLSISSPFSCNWKLLCSEWNQNNTEELTILRDKNLLENFREYLLKGKYPNDIFDSNIFNKNLMVPIRLRLKRGTMRRYSIISLPLETDAKLKVGPTQPVTKDKGQQSRKEIRATHKALLLKLKKKRHACKEKGEKVVRDKSIEEIYRVQMEKLWLPEPKTLRKSCNREVIGFVSSGGISFKQGVAIGLGYVPIYAFKTILQNKIKSVLVRNTNSRQYRHASLEIVSCANF